jgi:hypothetical protein
MLRGSAPSSSRTAAGSRRSTLLPFHGRRPAAAAAASDPQQPSTSSTSFLTVQLAQKESELAGLIAPGKTPPPAAVVGRLRDEIVALQAAIDGAPPPPSYVPAEAAAKAKARAAAAASSSSSSKAAVPRLLRPGSSAKYVGGEYGGEVAPKLKAPGGLPPPARRAVPEGPPTPVFEPALVTGRLVPWPVGGGGGEGQKKKKGAV